MSSQKDYDYESIQRRPLSFKGGSGKVEKKKKKKHKKDKKKMKQVRIDAIEEKKDAETSTPKYDKLTPAQRRFKEAQEKKQMDRIMKRATTTHRDRVEEFNRNLDALSEHYDIPKVSWTK